ncbi:autophagy-related protein 13-domain-containing protein [Lipomyces japonicus]|uniref:autophagy-related protein 13-domain-containing protein n=1 Tax=Lipomyces japonicus TaxID=56871 RepID=UPI0034CD61AB
MSAAATLYAHDVRHPPVQDSGQLSKLNQLIQNFFLKAAQVIVQSRISVDPIYSKGRTSPKVNKWFGLELEENEAFKDELRTWRGGQPGQPPLLIETVIDIRDLTANQMLVLLDDEGKRWNIETSRSREIVLERWQIELDPRIIGALLSELPLVYKKSTVLIRSLYAYVRLLPAWRLRKKLSKVKLNSSSLKVSCRVLNGAYPVSSRGRIGLSMPLGARQKDDHLQKYMFEKIDTPAGSFTVQVTYRKNCEFRVDDSESILSSHFLNLDERRSSAPARRYSRSSRSPPASNVFPLISGFNSVPADPSVSYGSMLSISYQNGGSTNESSSSACRSNSHDNNSKRSPSVSFPRPFNAPPLSESPSSSETASSSYPRISYRRLSSGSQSSLSREHQKVIPNIAAGTPQNLQLVSSSSVVSSVSSGSRTSSLRRYSSSFGSRGHWQASGSPSSNTLPLTSMQHKDDEELDEFVKMLDTRRPLKSYNRSGSTGSGASSSASGSSLKASLSRFQQLKDYHTNLTDSMSNSIVVQQQRSLSSVKTVSPHTPHTPAIPSRLSEGLNAADYRDEAVFEEDEHDEHETEDEDARNSAKTTKTAREGDDDELLFAMSDMVVATREHH